MATGLPTMLLRPTTTAFFPAMGSPVDSIMRTTPLGVQGTNTGSPATNRPMLYG